MIRSLANRIFQPRTAELRRERANRRQLEGHLDDFLKDGVHSAIHSTDDYSPTTTKPSATLRRLRLSLSW